MLIIINPTMPQDYRDSLLVNFSIIFPKFEEIDSRAKGFFPLFASIHFSWYNRYSTKVSFLSKNFQIINLTLSSSLN
jgi:hypothetical protein